jgi:hypothetical protein
VTVTLTDRYSWGIAHCSTPAEVAACLALPGSWAMGAQPTVWVRNDQFAAATGPPPPPVAGYVVWFDATQITGVADGTTLASWADASGNGNTVTQGTPANQPTYSTTAHAMAGHPAVWFSTNGRLIANTPNLPQPFSVFVVCQPDSLAAATARYAVGTAYYAGVGQLNSTSDWMAYMGASFDSAIVSAVGSPSMVVAVVNGATSTITVNGAAGVTGNPGTQPFNGTAIGVSTTTAAPPFTGWTGGFIGSVGEVIVYPFALTPAQVASLHGYAQSKWGTP